MCSEQSKASLQKRARRKWLNVPMLKHMLELDSPLHKKYLSTFYCSHRIDQVDGKTRSRYCKRMWCSVCAPIKTAIRINTYKDELNTLQGLHMTTLTIPNVPFSDIRATIQLFRKVFRQFRNTYKKSTGIVLRGVYNFECTHNFKSGLYHPHIHIIHEGLPTWETGAIRKDGEAHLSNKLIEYWLKKVPTATRAAQDTRPCFDLIEGFKYQALSIYKIKLNGKKEAFVPAAELDAIYQQLQGLRCFGAFGLKAKDLTEDDEDKAMDELTAYTTDKPEGSYLWASGGHDWTLTQHIDPETGEILNHVAETKLSIEITLSDFVPNKKQFELYEKLHSNHVYKQATRIYHPKRVGADSGGS